MKHHPGAELTDIRGREREGEGGIDRGRGESWIEKGER